MTLLNFIYTLIFVAAIVKIIFLVLHHKASRSSLRKQVNPLFPPSPQKLPIIGNLHQLGSNPHLSLTKLANELGPIFSLQLGDVPTIVVSSAELAKQVMKTHDRSICSRPQLYSAKCLFYNCTDIVFSPYGTYWRHVRKICILQLLSSKRVQSFAAVRREEVNRLVQRVESSVKHSSSGFSLTRLIGLYSNDILCRAILGRSFSSSSDEGSCEYDKYGFQSMLNEYQELLGGFSIGDFFSGSKGEFLYRVTGQKSRLQKTFSRFDRFFDEMIEEHMLRDDGKMSFIEEKDLLDVLLDVHREAAESSSTDLTRDNVKAILLDMFAAGTDTTFITLDWAMTELLMNPDIMKRAQEEITSVLGDNNTTSTISEEDLPQLHYLKAIVKEVFRLHPPVPILVPRESMEQVTIHRYQIPPKTRVLVNVWAIGRDPELWVEPERFNPDRFVGSSVDFRGQDFELLPFGAGRRICPGIEFGNVIVELGLAELLRRFDWELPSGVQAKDLDLREAFGISMHKVSDLFVVARPRNMYC